MAIADGLGFRTIAIGLAIATLAVATLFGGGERAGAAQLDDWGSKGDFAWFCGLVGGTYFESPQDGMAICVYPDGSREVCDLNGGNCTIYPPQHAPGRGGGRLDTVTESGATSGVLVAADPTPTPTPAPVRATRIDHSVTFAIDDQS